MPPLKLSIKMSSVSPRTPTRASLDAFAKHLSDCLAGQNLNEVLFGFSARRPEALR